MGILVTAFLAGPPVDLQAHTPEEKAFYLQSRIVLQLNPSDATAGSAVGIWHLEYNERDLSAAAFAGVLKHHPSHPVSATGLALIDEIEGRHEQALNRLEGLSDIPETLRPFLGLVRGRLHFRLKRYAKAEAFFIKALETEKAPHDLYFWLGQLQEATDREDAAVLSYQQAIEADPFWPGPYSRLSLIYQRKGKTAQAREMMERILSLDNPSPYPNNDIGVMWRWVMRGK